MERAIAILALIRKIGLVLAPEVIEWDLSPLGLSQVPLRTLQRRMCFTEIAPVELSEHCNSFGPLALSFNTVKLREAGAMPVIYVPQGLSSPLSQLAILCVNGAYHTKAVLGQLQQLKEISDPQLAEKKFGYPVDSKCVLDLRNIDSVGDVVASYSVPAVHAQQLLQYIGFNNIQFDHSIGILEVFLNMFYPADNSYKGEFLGYYRQREWRIIAGDVRLNGHPMGRELSFVEKKELLAIDPSFWGRSLLVNGNNIRRLDLALLYEPITGWNVFDLVESIYAPENVHIQIREIVESQVPIYAIP